MPPPDPGCKTSTDCTSKPDTPLCDAPSGDCVVLPPGSEIGVKDGDPASVALVTIYEPDKKREPTDLAFHPDRPNELWVVNRKDDYTIIITNPGTPDASVKRLHDPDAMHFMHRPPALAFGMGDTFGTCGDNNDNGGYFMGPALFSADLKIFAKGTPSGLGSHLDMLHSTSFCRGIAHVDANIYWVFNSNKKSLDKYDFHQDHGPGNDDHSDGEVWRYALGKVAGVNNVPSHVFYDAEDKLLYIADTGHKRILTLDTASGTLGKSFSGLETVKTRKYVNDASMSEIVPAGTLEAPSGIEVQDGLVFVSDNATSKLYAFEKGGKLVRTLDTGLPPGSLAGFTFGPDGKIYFVDLVSSQVHRIDPIL
ncbi:MAG: hypothetical protein ABI193_22530 [Minicystis sp.]